MDLDEDPAVTNSPNPFEEFSLEQLQQRTSMKWRRYPAEVLPVWVAEMDCGVAPAVREAVDAALALGDTGYSEGKRYAEALARYAARHWPEWQIDPELTCQVSDVMTGVRTAITMATSPGAPIVVTPPVYGPFLRDVSGMKRELVFAPLTTGGRLDPETLEQAFAQVAGKGSAVLISNPHNPTGAAHTREELETLVALANKHGVRVIADEIHAPLQLAGARFVPILTVAGADSAMSVFSASKAYNLAGIKAGLVIGGEATRAEMRTMTGEASHLGVISHVAALDHGDAWLEEVLVALSTNRDALAPLVSEYLPGASIIVPEATYLAWIDVQNLGWGDDPDQLLAEKAKVGFSGGRFFGPGGLGHIRVNFATSPAILREAFVRASTAL